MNDLCLRLNWDRIAAMRSYLTHLTLRQSQIPSGTEWKPESAAWSFVQVCEGRGYLMESGSQREIETGDLVVMASTAKASLRASQLGDLRVCHFGMLPGQLAGVFSARELQMLVNAASESSQCARIIRCGGNNSRPHLSLCGARSAESSAVARWGLLGVALEALRDVLESRVSETPIYTDVERKLADLAARLPESELLSHSAEELARECGCTERHLRRLFLRQFGISLKRSQIQWRVEQAKAALADSGDKIIDIASQCGFHSLVQFNVAFKRITGMTPSQWRQTALNSKARRLRRRPVICPQTAAA